MKEIINCIICKKSLIDTKEHVEDKLVSRKVFSLLVCPDCQLLHTSPLPLKKDLLSYYKSENYISHSQSSNNFFDKIYFMIRKYMMKNKVKLIINNTQIVGKILDYGCGVGSFLEQCFNEGWKGFGFEPEKNAKAIAQRKLGNVIFDNIVELEKLGEDYFDAITLWHVLEHVYELDELINIIKKLLKKKGVLIIALPNYESYDSFFYKENWAAYDVPRHLYHFNEKSIKLFMNIYGFKLEKKKPLIFDSFYISLMSENNRSIFATIRAFFVGLISNIYGYLKFKPFSSQIYILRKN